MTRGAAGNLNSSQSSNDWVRQHYGDVLRFVARRLGNPEDAADVTQESFVKALCARDRFRGECAPRTWLFRIAINTCRDHLRRRRRAQEWMVEADMNHPLELFNSYLPEDDLLAMDVRRCLTVLEDDLRKAVTLKYVNGLSFPELAHVLGCSRRVAVSRVRRAQRKMRRLMGSDVCRSRAEPPLRAKGM